MALGIYFAVQNMSNEKFQSVHAALDAIGQAEPKGRTFHCGFDMGGDNIHVFDVWESQEDFEAFGQHLMPILAEREIDPGEPVIAEIVRIQSN